MLPQINVQSGKDQLIGEISRLLSALAQGMRLLKQHYPDEFERLKKQWEGLWNGD